MFNKEIGSTPLISEKERIVDSAEGIGAVIELHHHRSLGRCIRIVISEYVVMEIVPGDKKSRRSKKNKVACLELAQVLIFAQRYWPKMATRWL